MTQNAAAETVREKLFTMRMSTEEWQRAEALAKHYGVTVASLLRMLLKERERQVAAVPSDKPSRPTRKR